MQVDIQNASTGGRNHLQGITTYDINNPDPEDTAGGHPLPPATTAGRSQVDQETEAIPVTVQIETSPLGNMDGASQADMMTPEEGTTLRPQSLQSRMSSARLLDVGLRHSSK